MRLAAAGCLLFVTMQAMAQNNTDLEGEVSTYVNIRTPKDVGAMAVASIYNNKTFCQFRYNYEDTRTFSFYWGRPIVKETKKYYVQLAPTLGLSAGNFMGLSPSVQLYAEMGNFEIYSSSQTSICLTDVNRSFFFTWTEAQYNYKNIIKAGMALQYLKQYPAMQRRNVELPAAPVQQQLDLGPVVSLQYWRFCASGYFFNLWSSQRHYAVSLAYNFK